MFDSILRKSYRERKKILAEAYTTVFLAPKTKPAERKSCIIGSAQVHTYIYIYIYKKRLRERVSYTYKREYIIYARERAPPWRWVTRTRQVVDRARRKVGHSEYHFVCVCESVCATVKERLNARGLESRADALPMCLCVWVFAPNYLFTLSRFFFCLSFFLSYTLLLAFVNWTRERERERRLMRARGGINLRFCVYNREAACATLFLLRVIFFFPIPTIYYSDNQSRCCCFSVSKVGRVVGSHIEAINSSYLVLLS